ncbi:MAG TPA: hypothetical protein DEP42_01070 [Ruminococcaceae bacterium]|nr:hypothetical protein [Oscillospiraceae bacterium]
MQEIIHKIIEVDRQAQAISAKAKTLRTDAEKTVRVDQERLHQEYLDRAYKRMDKTTHVESGFLQTSLDEIKKKYEKATNDLQAVCDDKHDEWVKELFKKVIGG